ncbi:YceI family protein [Sulfurimonas sp.]
MKKLLLVLLLSLPMFAGNLELSSGSIVAHTEMAMDSEINPASKNLQAKIYINGEDITTLSGKFFVDIKSFVSDNTDRDDHMYKSIDTDKYTLATFKVASVVQTNEKDIYKINGTLDFHDKKDELSAKAKITYKDGVLDLDADSMILMSKFGVEMPCMMFMCVRDQVDLKIKATFK